MRGRLARGGSVHGEESGGAEGERDKQRQGDYREGGREGGRDGEPSRYWNPYIRPELVPCHCRELKSANCVREETRRSRPLDPAFFFLCPVPCTITRDNPRMLLASSCRDSIENAYTMGP